MTNEQHLMLLIAKHDSLMMSMRHRKLTAAEMVKIEEIEKEIDERALACADAHYSAEVA